MKHKKHLLVGTIALASLLPFASAFGQTVTVAPNTSSAARHHPASVPDGYVITPFGYLHPSCIQKLKEGERLLSDGRVQHANGTAAGNVATCEYPRYTPSGNSAASPAVMPEVDGWLENASITTGTDNTSYGALVATWMVPPHPRADDGQVLYFFPGFEDIISDQSILQPVLGWYQHQWTIASWNCCLNGIVTTSPAVNVHPGDTIYGSITSDCPQGTVSCPTWNVLTLDLSTGKSTTLSNTPSAGQVFNWAFGGVLEPYYINSCDDYPPNRATVFENVTVFDEQLHPIFHPKWTETSGPGQTPPCGYAVRTNQDQVKLEY